MHVIVDANVLIAAFLKDSFTRKMLMDERLNIISPEHVFMEVRRVLSRPFMMKRIKINAYNFEKLWDVITSRIHTYPKIFYQAMMAQALRLADHPEDAPYIALALKLRYPVWTNDPGFQIHETKKVITIYKTRELASKVGIADTYT